MYSVENKASYNFTCDLASEWNQELPPGGEYELFTKEEVAEREFMEMLKAYEYTVQLYEALGNLSLRDLMREQRKALNEKAVEYPRFEKFIPSSHEFPETKCVLL